MFPDSAVAAKYGSARTKTACIVESLADFDAKRIVDTRSAFLTAKLCTKFAQDPAGGAHDAPPDPLVGWGGRNPLLIPHPLGAFGASSLRSLFLIFKTWQLCHWQLSYLYIYALLVGM